MDGPWTQFQTAQPDGPWTQFQGNNTQSGLGGHVDNYLADKPGLANDIQALLSKRADAVTSAKDLPNFLISSARLGVGGAADVGGAILSRIPGAGLVGDAAGYAAHKIGELPTAGNSTFGDVGRSFSGMLDTASKVYPTAANALGYGKDVLNLGAEKALAETGPSLIRRGVNKLSDLAPNPKGPSLSLAEQAARDKGLASAGYEAQADIPFTDDQLKGLRDNLNSLVPNRDASARVWNNSAASGHVKDLLETMDKEPLTFDGALDQRNDINDSWAAAKKAGKSAEADRINNVKEALDKTMMNPETANWQAGNHKFAIAATKQDFSSFVDTALDKAQPANSLDGYIGKYLNSWRGKLLRPNEREILEQLTSNSFGKELKKNIAGRLTTYAATGLGAAMGGPMGAVAGDLLGTFASKLARDSAMADKVAGLQEFFDTLDKREMPKIAPPSPPRPPSPIDFYNPGGALPGPAGYAAPPSPHDLGFSNPLLTDLIPKRK